jgi:TrmH RNA methyltransferase
MAPPTDTAPPGAPGPARDEQTVYGVKAALALLQHRPQAVRRIYHGAALREELGPHLAAVAARHLPYRELDGEALAKVAESAHHEGLVVGAAARRLRPGAAGPAGAAGRAALWLALDRVENPHNLGALVRTAAFFGLSGVLAGGVASGDKINTAVLRVSEGGAELVPLFGVPDLPDGLRALREAGCRVLGLETDGSLRLADAVIDGLTAGPLALVLGQERAGLSTATRSACDNLCVLEGGGPLASLNVSVAAAVALAQVLHDRARPHPLPAEAPAQAARGAPQAHRPQRPGRTRRPARVDRGGPAPRRDAGAGETGTATPSPPGSTEPPRRPNRPPRTGRRIGARKPR